MGVRLLGVGRECLPAEGLAWVVLTLTCPAQCLEEPQEQKSRQEETYTVLQGGARETWWAGEVRVSS